MSREYVPPFFLQIVPYVNGTLYCIFGFAKIRSAAKEMAFEQILHKQLNKAFGESHEQIPIVIKVLRGGRRRRVQDESRSNCKSAYTNLKINFSISFKSYVLVVWVEAAIAIHRRIRRAKSRAHEAFSHCKLAAQR